MVDRRPTKSASRQKRAAERDREAIRRAGILQDTIKVATGRPLPIYDQKGKITGYTDPPDLNQRMAAATTLIRKVLPDLKAVDVDLQASGEGMLQLVLAPGVAPPASVDHTGDTIEGVVSPPQALEDARDEQEALALPETPEAAPEPAPAPAPAPSDNTPPIRRRVRKIR